MNNRDGELRGLLERSLEKIEELKARLNEAEAFKHEPIAVVGFSGRFPAAASADALWDLLDGGHDAIREIPHERWSKEQMPAAVSAAFPAVRWAGIADGISGFDAEFFGISPVEAETLDPQQRLLLELAWEAFEHAGIPATSLLGQRAGTFIGIAGQENRNRVITRAPEELDLYATTGNALCTASGRLSYFLGMQGPCISVETACSSSLVAVHLACQSLRASECTLALAGGINLVLSPLSMAMLARTEALSPDGRCKSFDAGANGFVRGDGGGLVVLKRLSDAVRDGDKVWLVIRGSAVNHDGRSTGLTTPNVLSQQALIRQALQNARVSAAQIGYVEAHGTGTSLGDPIEAEAIRRVLGKPRADGSKCVVGTVKASIGHLEAAAGIAGLIKVILSVQHEKIPRLLHFQTLNPRIEIEGSALHFPKEAVSWKRGETPRMAGVSSFGISGTNAHLVVEEPPIDPDVDLEQSGPTLVPLSAKTPRALAAYVRELRRQLRAGAALCSASLYELAANAARRRSHHRVRIALVASSREDLEQKLELAEGLAESAREVFAENERAVWVFSGQGGASPRMAAGLMATEPVFRAAVEECDAEFKAISGRSISEELSAGSDSSRMAATEVAQACIFAIQFALAALLRSWGIEPEAVVGHSVGEVAAAVVAGALSLRQGLELVHLRGTSMSASSGKGRMLAVRLNRTEAQALLSPGHEAVCVATLNGPRSTVFSGPIAAIEALRTELDRKGIEHKAVAVDSAFHSQEMDSVAEHLRSSLGELRPGKLQLRMYGGVTGGAVQGEELSADYWSRNVRQPVQFVSAIEAAIRDGARSFLELGPRATLSADIQETLDASGIEGLAIPTLRRGVADHEALQQSVAELYQAGQAPDFARLFPRAARALQLPFYPWQRERFWVELERPESSGWLAPGTQAASGPLFAEFKLTDASGTTIGSAQSVRLNDGLLAEPRLPAVPDARDVGRAPKAPAQLRALVAEVLKTSPERINERRSFRDQGLDSLLALRLSNVLRARAALDVSPVQLLREESLESLNRRVASQPPALAADALAPDSDRVRQVLSNALAALLKTPVERIPPQRELRELGLDSLLALRLKNQIRASLGQEVSAASLLRGASINSLVLLFESRATGDGAPNDAAHARPGLRRAPSYPLDQLLSSMNDEEARSLLGTLSQDLSIPVPTGSKADLRSFLAAQGERFYLAPVSYGQASMHFVYQLVPDAVGYNVMCAARVPLELDVAALEGALRRLVQRHALLRTTYMPAGGKVFQRINLEPSFEFIRKDDASLSDADLHRVVSEQGHRPYDLQRGPIFRAVLVTRPERDRVLLIGTHHITCDAGSLEAMLQDLKSFYGQEVSGDCTTIEQGLPFERFVDWQNRWLASPDAERALQYWTTQLSPPPARVDLGRLARAGSPVVDHSAPRRPAVQSFEGKEYFYRFEGKTTAKLKAVARREGVTLYNLLTAGFVALLHKLTGADDIPIGAYANLRSEPEFEAQVGYYVNAVVLRARPNSGTSFLELLRSVQELTLGALEHQNYPIALLAEKLKAPREPGRQLWFDYVVNWTPGDQYHASNAFFMDAAPPASSALGDLPLAPFPIERKISQFDVSLNMGENDGVIYASVVYNSELFDHETAVTLMSRLQLLLLQVAEEPNLSLGALSLLDATERRMIVEDFNRTESPFDQGETVHGAFVAWAERNPDTVALRFTGGSFTYGELHQKASDLARVLRDHGARPGSRVGICIERSPALLVGLLAILIAGAAYVPLDPAYPTDRLKFMLEDSAAALLLTSPASRAKCAVETQTVVTVGDDFSTEVALGAQPPACAADGVAYVIYTSGSTGRPKGVMVGQRSVAALFHWADGLFEAHELRGVLASTSVCFDISVFEIFYPLARGGSLILVENALLLSDSPHRDSVTLINTVPSVMSAVLQISALPTSVVTVTLVGEPLRRSLVDRIYAQPSVVAVHNLYGPTEDTVFSTAVIVARDSDEEPTIGRPIPNTRAYVLDERLAPVPPYQRGELYLAGDGLALGYHGRPELNAERFIADPFHPGERMYKTGDLSSFRANGEIDFFGRSDYQVKIRGYRIELEEIESSLNRCPGVLGAAVIARRSSLDDTAMELVAYVAQGSSGGSEQTDVGLDPERQQEITQLLKQSLPDYMVPNLMVFLKALPQTPNGKVDRKALPVPPTAKAKQTAQRGSALELELAKIWGEVLEIDAAGIGPRDKFYELGGSSLRVAKVAALVRERLGQSVSLIDLFRFQDIESIANWLEQGDVGGQAIVSAGGGRGSTRRAALFAAQQKIRHKDSPGVISDEGASGAE